MAEYEGDERLEFLTDPSNPLHRYVDRDVIAEQFSGDGLSAEEQRVAVDGVVKVRAQFVVDHIAAELAGRLPDLERRETQLTDELAVIRDELAIVHGVLGEPALPPWSESLPKERVRHRLNLLAAIDNRQRPNTVLEAIKDEPPFLLMLHDANDSGMAVKLQEHADKLEEYGPQAKAVITRATGVFTRYRYAGDWMKQIDAGVVRSVICTEAGTVIQIDNPKAFFAYLLHNPSNHFGKKSVVGLLCAADIFAEEAERIAKAPKREVPLY